MLPKGERARRSNLEQAKRSRSHSMSSRLPAHPVESIAKAILSRMTNMKAGRYEGATFTGLFIDDALRTGGKVLNLRKKYDDRDFHFFLHDFDGPRVCNRMTIPNAHHGFQVMSIYLPEGIRKPSVAGGP